MSEAKTDILTPVGRLVAGDCFKGSTTDAEGNPLVIKTGPNAGQSRTDYFMAVAIPKTDPGVGELYSKIVESAKQSFPRLFDAAGNCVLPTFAFKVVDGDSVIPNRKGTRPCDKEGYPGNWVFHFSGGFAPKCYTAGGASLITDPEAIKKGYYIRIYGSVTGNGSTQQPGVFLNHSMVELVAYGDVIVSGPDGSAIFGGTPTGALPAGASATPLAPQTPLAVPGVQPAAAVPGVQPAAAVPGVQPAPDFLNPAPTPAPVVEQFSVQGATYTRDQLRSFGWTDAQIDAQPRV